MTPPIVLPDHLADYLCVVSLSGGKDSAAVALALREAGVPARYVFADTGWEAPETYRHLDVLREKLGTVDVVRADRQMIDAIAHRAGFPARMQRWCTREMPTWEDDPEWGGWMWRPLLAWSVEDVVAIHKRHGVPLNPLYHRGHDRVGCFPCIFANKGEIKLVAEHAPDRIDLIRALEKRTTDERQRRMVETPDRYSSPVATFFQGNGSRGGKGFVTIDDVVAWSKTTRGGRQYSLPLLAPPPSGGCFRWGVCEAPSDEEAA